MEIAIGYSISFVFALLIFFIEKWISKSVVKILGKALRKVGYRDWETDRKSTRLNSSHITRSRMPSSA